MNTLKYKGFIGSVAFSEADGVFSIHQCLYQDGSRKANRRHAIKAIVNKSTKRKQPR